MLEKSSRNAGLENPIIGRKSGPGDNVVLTESGLVPCVIEFASAVDEAHKAGEKLYLRVLFQQINWLLQTILEFNKNTENTKSNRLELSRNI